MSFIEKMLASECLDPCADVCFVAVLCCASKGEIEYCQSIFAPIAAEIRTERYESGYHFLFIGQEGIDIDATLLLMNKLLDDRHGGVELVETKVVNLGITNTVKHSFVFRQKGEADATTIILSPSHAFGSGGHPSTGLAIQFLEELAPLESRVLDVGCGTGVLSLIALKLGARSVLGVDIDEKGLCGAILNAKLNHLENRVQFENKKLTDVTDTFPLILANLTCSVLKYLLADIADLASPGARLVVSGLQGRQGVEAEVFLREFGWHVSKRKSAGKWQALLATRSA